ncbi:MAG: MFS transporter [Candidatus Latescibacteria bacterium]|nr:MFS transporter [Candidatus Latescibacterota bacterium]
MKVQKKRWTGYAIGAMILPSVCTVILSVGSISISETFQLGLDKMGLLFWALNGGLFAAYLVGGGLCDRFGERPMLFGGTIICAGGALLCQSADSLLELGIGVFALGVGGGILWLAAIVLLNHLHRERRRLAMGGSQMAISVACVIGPPAIAYLIRWQDWRVPYAVLSAYMIGMVILLYLLRIPTSGSREKKGSSAIDIGLFRERRYGLLNLCALLHSGAEAGISTWVCLYVSRRFGIPEVSASLGLMVYALGMVFGRGVVSKLPERYSDVQVLKICAAGSGLFVLLLFLKVNYVGALAFLALIGFFIGGDWPVLLMYAGKHFPNRSGVVIGHLSLSGSVGGFVFLPLMGLVSEYTGIGAMMSVPLVLLLALFLTVSGLGRVDLVPRET